MKDAILRVVARVCNDANSCRTLSLVAALCCFGVKLFVTKIYFRWSQFVLVVRNAFLDPLIANCD